MIPTVLVGHLSADLPGAWKVAELPRLLRRRAYGARLLLGDCQLFVAATCRRVDVLALDPKGIVYFCPDAHPSQLLANVRAAARAVLALHSCDAPTWATEPTP